MKSNLKSYGYERYDYPNGYTNKPPENGTLWYGDLHSDRPNLKPRYLEVPYTMYSDYSGGTVERANCQAFLEQFGELPGVYPVYGGYGTTGVVIRRALLRNEDVLYVLEGLDDYPLINEDVLSELEFELEAEAWDTWVEFDLQRALDKAGIPYNPDTLRDTFYNVICEHDIYWLHEDAVCPFIDIDQVVENWPA